MTTTVQRILASAILPALLITRADAQLSISGLNQPYLVNFDTTVAGVNSGLFAGSGFIADPTEAQSGFLDSNAWEVKGFTDAELTFGGEQTAGDFARGTDDGAVTTGGIYAFTGGSIQGAALGVQPTGADATPGSFTLRIQNSSGAQITGFTLDYTVHVLNNDTRGNTFNFSHSADNTLFTNEAALDLASGTAAAAVPVFEANLRTISLADLTLQAGAFYYLRWTTDDLNGGGARDEFALDDIRIQGFTTTATVRNYWDPNGSAPGLGGSGNWTGTGLVFNESADGTGPAVAAVPTRPTVFSETGGVVVVGAGATANNGIEVTVDGYSFTGGSIALGGAVPAFKVTNANDTTTVAASISGSAGLRKTGAGRLVLSADNSATLNGSVTIQEGVLEISADNQLGAPANPVVLASGTLKTTASLMLDAARALSGAGTLDIAPATTLTVAGASSFGNVTLSNTGQLAFTSATPSTGAITFQQPTTVSAPNGTLAVNGDIATTHTSGTALIAPNLNIGNGARIFTVADGSAAIDLRLNGNISGDAGARLTKFGDGTLDVAGDLSGLLGGVTLGNLGSATDPLRPGGTLRIHNETSLGAAVVFFNSGAIHADSPAALVFNNGVSFAAGRTENGATFSGAAMTFLGVASLFSPSGAFMQHRIQADTDVTFAGGFNAAENPGSGTSTGVTIAGTGTIHLPHTENTVALPITVDGGKLRVSGSIQSTSVTVIGDGVLSGATEGTERISSAIIGNAGTIAPGDVADATNKLHLSTFQLGSGGTYAVDLGAVAAGEFDQLSVSSDINLAGSLQIELVPGYLPIPGDQFIIILNEGLGAVTGTFAGISDDTSFPLLGTAFAVNYNGGDGNDVVLTVIPEPASAMLFIAGAFVLARRRRAIA